MQTYGDVKAFVAAQTSEDETDTILSARLLPRWVQRALERIQRFTYWRFTQARATLSWPSTGILYLPQTIYRIDSMFGTGRYPVVIMPYFELDQQRPGSAVAFGRRDRLVMHGMYHVEADVATAGVVTATMASAPGATQSVRIWGLDTNDYDLNETVTVPDGGSVATTGSFKSGPGGVQGVELLGTASEAIITITDAGGTQIERLDSSFETRHDHWRTELYPTATGATASYEVRYWRRLIVPTNVNDNWGLPLPYEYHDLVETWVESELERWRKDYQSASLLRSQFMQDLREAIAHDRRDPSRRLRFRINPQFGGTRR